MRRHLFALLLLAGMAAMLFLPAMLRQEVFTFRDHVDYFQPLRWFTASELRAGNLPLWNPYSAAGEPWLANPQTGVCYPPFWIFLALPFPAAYMTYLLLHVVLLGWGAYFLFARDVTKEAAMVGAAALMFCGPALSMLDVSNNLATFAWIPLVILAARAQRAIAGGVCLALAFLAGEPFFAAIAALLFVLASRRVRVIAIAAVVAAGLSAVQLLPFVESLIGSDRASGLDAAQILRDSMPLRQWVRLAIPPPLGALDAKLGQHFVPVVYSGLLVVALAAVGLFVAVRKERRLVAWAALVLAAMLIAAGPHALVSMPLTLFRYPARLIGFGALGIAALAAIGWSSIRPGKRWADLLLVLVVVGDLLAHAQPLLRTAPFDPRVPYPRAVGGESLFLRLGPFDGNRRSWISGYLNLYERRFDAYTAAPVVAADYQRFYGGLLDRSWFRLDAASIGHVLTSRRLGRPFALVAQSGSTLAYAYRPSSVATLWDYATPAPSREVALERLLGRDRAWSVAGLPEMIPGRYNRPTPLPFEITTSRATVTVETREQSLVVLTQRDARGWSVEVDGRPAEKLYAGGIFRAVMVDSGRHQIVWKYRPLSFFVGLVLTSITLAGVAFGIFLTRSKREFFSSLRA